MSVRNSLLVLLFGGTLGVFCLREQQRGTLEGFDRVHREFLKANPATGGQATSTEDPAVVFARVDDVDQAKHVFRDWPLDDDDWQIVLQNLPAYTPKAVALSVPFRFDKAGAGMESAASSVQGLSVAAEASTSAGDGPQTLPAGVPELKVTGSSARIPEFKSIKAPVIPAGGAPAEIDLAPRQQKITVEGDWCRVPLLARLGEKVVPSLALRALLEWEKVSAKDVTVQLGVAISFNKRRIPIDEGGFFRYFLSLAPEVPAVNADDFVLPREQTLNELPSDDPRRRALTGLKSSLLWFGQDDVKSRILKLPNGTPVSAAELTVRAIAAIQTDSYMRPLLPDLQWIPAASTLLFCLWLTNWRKSRLWPGAFFAAVALVGVSLYFYRRDHQWMPLVPSLAVLGATVLLSFLLPSRGWREAAETETADTRKTKTRPLEPGVPPKQSPGSRSGTKTKSKLVPPARPPLAVPPQLPPKTELPPPVEPTVAVPDPWEEAFSRPVKNAHQEKKGKKKKHR
ncbi:MAG TPA: CHASE2 domain-containing protein [Verrucomicrobiales bacterium]|jgi:hypothetical protein|nr:CHASE2 domain-containing protein [Verrucomicrobiales bacterium]